MKIDVNNALTIFTLASIIIGGIYHIARIEANINSKINNVRNDAFNAIDAVKDKMVDRFYAVERRVEITEVRAEERGKHYDHVLWQLNGRMEHQGNRIKDWIEQIAEFLREKSDASFHIRDRKL